MPLKSKIKDFLATAEGFYLSELLNKIGLNVEQFLIYCKGVKKKVFGNLGGIIAKLKEFLPHWRLLGIKHFPRGSFVGLWWFHETLLLSKTVC